MAHDFFVFIMNHSILSLSKIDSPFPPVINY